MKLLAVGSETVYKSVLLYLAEMEAAAEFGLKTEPDPVWIWKETFILFVWQPEQQQLVAFRGLVGF